MYRLLIVDDEDIEREGMAELIDWQEYGVEIVGTAWNGAQALEMIQTLVPDVVITDVKMPVMDGIELIRRTKKEYPQVVFIVLSGYGEYEFTSQAMEEGVRHYLLKPCDERKIEPVLEKAKGEVDRKREEEARNKEYYNTVNRLLPRAREQVFRNLLLGREQLEKDYQMFLKEIEVQGTKVRVLAFRGSAELDSLEQFVLGNILGEILGREKLLSTVIQKDILFLMEEMPVEKLEEPVIRAAEIFRQFDRVTLWPAISQPGSTRNLREMYRQVQELYKMGEEREKELLSYEQIREKKNEASVLMDFSRVSKTDTYEEIMKEVFFAFAKMEVQEYSWERKVEAANWCLKILYGEEIGWKEKEQETSEKSWLLLEQLADRIAEHQLAIDRSGKEEQRLERIVKAIFQHLKNPDLGIQFLAREVLYMNEDYFGRIFVKQWNMKFSAYLLELRISFAQRLIRFEPEILLTQLAQMLGFSPDGQYFSKAFRKITGMSPSQYRKQIKEK